MSRNRTKAATILAIAMHLAGIAGIAFGMEELFGLLTPFNLAVMFLLLIYTAPERSPKLLAFFAVAFTVGFAAEMTGIHTGILFGNYSYGSALGFKINGVPFMIGVNWFIVVYASGMIAVQIRNALAKVIPVTGRAAYSRWLGFSVIIDGALIATLFDLIMEPAAVRLGFWSWEGGQIPTLNYITWFALSALILSLFHKLKLRHHAFAVNLLLIQAMFFALINLR